MLGRCIPTCSKSLTGILQKCSRYSPTVSPALSLLEPSVNNFVSFKQPKNKVNSSVTGVLNRTYSTFISLRSLSTEDNTVPSSDVPAHSEENPSIEDIAVSSIEEDLIDEEVDEIDEDLESHKQQVEEERQRNMEAQEKRINAIQIRGLPETDDDEELTAQVLRLLEAIGVSADPTVIEELFYFRNGNVLCQFTERKWVNIVFSRIRNLRYSGYSGVYINQSLCQAYAKIDYNLKVLKREGEIGNCRVYNGNPGVQLHGSDEWIDVTHMQDLVDLGLVESV